MDAQSEIMQGREATYEELQAKVEEGIGLFLKKIAKNYGADTQQEGMVISEYEREFHKLNHTVDLLATEKVIEEAIDEVERETGKRLVSKEDMLMVRLFIAAHDSVVDKDELGKNMRKYNEARSADDLKQWMIDANNNDQGIIYFKPIRFQEAEYSIIGTIPDFVPINAEKTLFTVTQPDLKNEAPLSAYCVALCDLGDPGVRGFEAIFKAGIQLAIEDNPGINRRLYQQFSRGATIDDAAVNVQESATYDAHRLTLVNALKFQYGFAVGQKARFERIVQHFPAPVQEKLRQKFSHYDETIAEAKQMYKVLDTLDTEQVLKLAFGTPEQSSEVRNLIRDKAVTIPDSVVPVPDEEMLRNLP